MAADTSGLLCMGKKLTKSKIFLIVSRWSSVTNDDVYVQNHNTNSFENIIMHENLYYFIKIHLYPTCLWYEVCLFDLWLELSL